MDLEQIGSKQAKYVYFKTYFRRMSPPRKSERGHFSSKSFFAPLAPRRVSLFKWR